MVILFISSTIIIILLYTQLKKIGSSLKIVDELNYAFTAPANAQMLALKATLEGYDDALIKVALSTGKFSAEQGIMALTAAGLTEEEAAQAVATLGLGTAQAGTTAFTAALSAAFKGLAITIKDATVSMAAFLFTTPAGWATLAVGAIVGLTAATVKWSQEAEKAKQQIRDTANEAKNSISTIQSDYKTHAQTVNDLKDRYAELAQGVGNLGKATQNQGTLNTDEYSEFLDISNQLADAFPSLTSTYDENGNAILRLNGNTNTIVNSLNTLLDVQEQLANQKVMQEMPDVWEGYKLDINDAQKEVDQYKQNIDDLRNGYSELLSTEAKIKSGDIGGLSQDEFGNFTINADDYTAILDKYDVAYEKLEDGSIKLKEAVSDAYVRKMSGVRTDLESAQSQLEQQTNSIDQYLSTWLNQDWSFAQIEDSGLQDAVRQMILDFDMSSLPDDVKNGDWEDVQKYFSDNIIKEINKAKDNPAISEAFSEIFNNADITPSEKANYLSQIQEYFGKDSDIVIGLKPVFEANDADLKAYNEAINKQFNDTNSSVEKSKKTLEDYFNTNHINTAEQLADWNNITAGAKSAQEAIEMWEAAGKTASENVVKAIDDATEGVTNLQTAYANLQSAISASNSGLGLSTEDINNVKSMYSSLEGYDADKLFASTSNGVKLNAQELAKLNKEYEKQTAQKYFENTKEAYDKWCDAIARGAEQSEVDSLKEAYKNAQMLESQYAGLTSAYNKFLQAQSQTGSNEEYDTMRDAADDIKTKAKNKLWGDKDLKAYAEYFTGKDLSDATIDEIEATYKEAEKIRKKYFTADDDFSGTDSFIDKLDKLGYISGDAKDMSLSIDDIAKAADEAGMSVDAFNALLGKLEQTGWKIDYGDDLTKQAKEAEAAAETLKESFNFNIELGSGNLETVDSQIKEIKEAFTNEDGVLDFSVEDGQAAIALLRQLMNERDALAGKPATFDIDTSGADASVQEAVTKLNNFYNMVQSRNHDAELGLDTSEADKKIQDTLKELGENETITKTLDIDTSSSQSVIDTMMNFTQEGLNTTLNLDPGNSESIIETVKDLDGSQCNVTFNIIQGKKEVDADNIQDKDVSVTVNTVKGTIDVDTDNIKDKSVDITVNTNADEVSGTLTKLAEDQQKTISINSNAADVKKVFSDLVKPAIKRIIISSNVRGLLDQFKKLTKTETKTIHIQKTGDSGGVVTGTASKAFAGGTTPAFATRYKNPNANSRGELKHDTVALVNEQNQESVVHQGNWRLLEGGAHFEHLSAGDIVFSAEQTRQLLEEGEVTAGGGHGRTIGNVAFADGTIPAFSNTTKGSGAKRGGGSSKKDKKNTTKSKSSKSSNSNTKKKSTKKKGNSNKDKGDETVDWIEIRIERIQQAIDNFAKVAGNTFENLSTRITNTNSEIEKSVYKINQAKLGVDEYLKKAESIDLDKDLKARVRDGSININNYSSKTQEKIQEYQDWYNKYVELKDSIEDIQQDISKLFVDTFNNIAEDYESKLSLLEHLTNTYNNGIAYIEERGYLATTKYYEASKKVETENLSTLQSELKALEKEYSSIMNNPNSRVKEGSQEWYELQQKINEVKESIQETTTEIVKLNNEIRQVKWDRFDYLQEQISTVTEEAEFLVDLMSNSDLYEDNGQLTKTGQATLAMYGQSYNVLMNQADKYKQEMLSVSKELANDPYNTTLLNRRNELIKSQREAILAAEDQKQSIKSLVEDGINKEISSLENLIDKYNETLDNAKD